MCLQDGHLVVSTLFILECGTGPSVLIKKVALFQNYACTHLYILTQTVGTVLIREVVLFQR